MWILVGGTAQESGQSHHLVQPGSGRTNLLPAARPVLDGILRLEFDLPPDVVDRLGSGTEPFLQGRFLALQVVVLLDLDRIVATAVGDGGRVTVVRWVDGDVGILVQRHLIRRTFPLRREPSDRDRGLRLKTFECMYRARVQYLAFVEHGL